MLFDAEPLPEHLEPFGLLTAILQDGTREWRWELDQNLPEEAVVWQPYPGGHSIGGILLHIIVTEIYWFERVALGLPYNQEEMELLMAKDLEVDEWSWPAPPKQPISWYFDMHDKVRARVLERIKRWPPADTKIQAHQDLEVTPRWILGHVIQHEAYHGGQAVLINRLWQLRDR